MIVECNSCGKQSRIDIESGSRRFRCPYCSAVIDLDSGGSEDRKAGDSKSHYLLSQDSHMKLPFDREITLGRAVDCDMVIEDTQVSRYHAKLIWNGYAFMVKDMGSRNGIYFGNMRQDSAILKDRDVFNIGGHVFGYRFSDGSVALSDMLADFRKNSRCSETAEMPGTRNMIPSDDFNGSIGNMSVTEICQLLQLNQRSGRLSLFDPDKGRGAVFFHEGNIMHADFGHLHGDEAVYEILKCRKGSFSFQAQFVFHDRNVEEDTRVLLMEAARRNDER